MNVALFVTCLVDLMRPSVGFAAMRLLEHAGCEVSIPTGQTCCGQPAYNNGDTASAQAIARQVIDLFAPYRYVVAPSGSCAGMLRKHYPALFVSDGLWGPRARDLADRTHELVSFLTDVVGLESVEAEYEGDVTYHDSCSSLREMRVHDQPRRLLRTVRGLNLVELPRAEQCCGFGGTFCVKYPDISRHMVDAKIDAIGETHADTLAAGDLGCLLNIAGRLRRRGQTCRVFHVAELLAGMTASAAIGEEPQT